MLDVVIVLDVELTCCNLFCIFVICLMWDVKLRFSLIITPSTLFSLTLVSGFLLIVTGIYGGGRHANIGQIKIE